MNGLNPEIFFEWARIIGLGRDESAYSTFGHCSAYSSIGGIICMLSTCLTGVTNTSTEQCDNTFIKADVKVHNTVISGNLFSHIFM